MQRRIDRPCFDPKDFIRVLLNRGTDGEAVGWAIIAALVGAVSVIIGESLAMPYKGGFWGAYRALTNSAFLSLILALSLGIALALLEMDSLDGQAITSRNMAIMAGAAVSLVGVASGILAGVVLRRIVIALAP